MEQRIFKKISTFFSIHFRNYTTPINFLAKDSLDYWQEKILLYLLFIFMAFVPIAYIPSVVLAINEGLWFIAIFDTIGYAFLIYLFVNKKLSIKFRIKSILMIGYVLGVMLLLAVGPLGAGYLWLFIVPILAAIFLETKSAFIALVINTITLFFIGLVHHLGITSRDASTGFSIVSWSVISTNFIFLNIITTISIMFIIRGLEKSLINQKNIAESLIERSKELKIAKEEAEKSELIKSNFLTQMSHEIRTPINTILSYISLLKDKFENSPDEEIIDYFGTIDRGSFRIIRTIDMILNMSEIQAGSYKIQLEPLSIYDDILNPLITEFRLPAKSKNIELSTLNELSTGIKIQADRYSVTQIFANLIDNAIKYTNHGKIEIRVTDGDGKIKVEVTDTGIGMSEEYLKNIFNPFSQEEGGYTRKYEGSGLGLSLVKNYCNLNNAELSVESLKGQGSKFTVGLLKNWISTDK